MSIDRDLMFGVVACQMGLISRDSLLEAMRLWLGGAESGFPAFLVSEQFLSSDDQLALDAVIARMLGRSDDGSTSELLSSHAATSLMDELEQLQHTPSGKQDTSVSMTTEHTPREETREFPATTTKLDPVRLPELNSRFRILRHHASGGLGEVSIARDRELNRDVALKVIRKPHARNPASRSRFLLEAEVTGGLEHPGIVPVYSLGQYDEGVPYYAMRFIRGQSLKEAITEFHRGFSGDAVHESNLAFRQLLSRFIDVCNAIEYAHSRGVLHRDLKPSNIMLGKYGETLVVDWGLAKPKDGGSDERSGESPLVPKSLGDSSETLPGSALGTPSYMSPEQAAGKIAQLGRRSDIYSLGATLYSILTNRVPVDGKTLPETIERVKRGEFPAPRQCNPEVPVPLEAVCLKAMSLNPDHRYESAAQLASEIENWLADEPVEAWREPLLVRSRRWIKRNQTLVGASSAAVAVAVVALVIGLTALAQTNRQLDSAKTQLEAKNDALGKSIQRVEQAESDTRIEATKVEAINDFLISRMLAAATPEAALGRKITVEEVVDQASTEVETAFEDQPDVKAKVRSSLAKVYISLAVYEPAEEHLTETLVLCQQLQDDKLLFETKGAIGLVLLEKGELDEAEPLLKEAVEGYRRLHGAEHPDTLTGLNNVALLHQTKGEMDRAEQLYREVLQVRLRVFGEAHTDTIGSLTNLGLLLQQRSQLAEAEQLFQRAIVANDEIRDREHPSSLTLLNNYALTLQSANKLDEAEQVYREVVDARTRVLGPDHHHTLISLGNLGRVLHEKGVIHDAEKLLEQSTEGLRRELGQEHPSTLTAMNNYALTLDALGKSREAEKILRDVVDARKRVLGAEHQHTVGSQGNLGLLLQQSGRVKEAEALQREVIQNARASYGAEHPFTTVAMNNLALTLQSLNQLDEAERLFRDTLEIRQRTLGGEHPYTILSLGNLGMLLRGRGRLTEAEPFVRDCFEAARKQQGAEHPDTLTAMNNYALILSELDRHEQAKALFEDLYQKRSKVLGKQHPHTMITALNLASVWIKLHQLDEAEALLKETLNGFTRAVGNDHPYTLATMNLLALNYQRRGNLEEAEILLRRVLEIKRTKANPEQDARMAGTLDSLSALLLDGNKADEALPLLEESRELRQATDSPAKAGTLALLGWAYIETDRPMEAEPILRECLQRRRDLPADHWLVANAENLLASCIGALQRHEEVEAMMVESYNKLEQSKEASPNRRLQALKRVVRFYESWGKPAKAEEWKDKLPE